MLVYVCVQMGEERQLPAYGQPESEGCCQGNGGREEGVWWGESLNHSAKKFL